MIWVPNSTSAALSYACIWYLQLAWGKKVYYPVMNRRILPIPYNLIADYFPGDKHLQLLCVQASLAHHSALDFSSHCAGAASTTDRKKCSLKRICLSLAILKAKQNLGQVLYFVIEPSWYVQKWIHYCCWQTLLLFYHSPSKSTNTIISESLCTVIFTNNIWNLDIKIRKWSMCSWPKALEQSHKLCIFSYHYY